MNHSSLYDVIIIGGSYAGLSAAMSLGRSLRNVLVIDSGKPCNRQTPHSHNFITQDGSTPQQISSLAKESTPELVAVRLLAEYHLGKDIVADVKSLVGKEPGNLTVQLAAGIVLERAGETEEALAVLSKHEGSLDAYVHSLWSYGLLNTGLIRLSVALIIQIHLRQNRTDLAAKEAQRARKWAQDSLLVNLAESWVGMREVRSLVNVKHSAMN